jgi:hypothetical protein
LATARSSAATVQEFVFLCGVQRCAASSGCFSYVWLIVADEQGMDEQKHRSKKAGGWQQWQRHQGQQQQCPMGGLAGVGMLLVLC